jgi:hypothetical protein
MMMMYRRCLDDSLQGQTIRLFPLAIAYVQLYVQLSDGGVMTWKLAIRSITKERDLQQLLSYIIQRSISSAKENGMI